MNPVDIRELIKNISGKVKTDTYAFIDDVLHLHEGPYVLDGDIEDRNIQICNFASLQTTNVKKPKYLIWVSYTQEILTSGVHLEWEKLSTAM